MSVARDSIIADPALSTVADAATGTPIIDFSNEGDSETLSGSVPRETVTTGSTDPDTDVPRETVTTGSTDPDPVGDAVATAVEQWIGFDPAIHAVNPDGTPRLKVDGTYARKRGKGGRKSGEDDTSGVDDLFGTIAPGPSVSRGTPDTSTTAPQYAQTPQTAAQVAPNLSSAQAAAMMVIASTTILSKMIGPEWAAEKQEQKALIDATKIYLDAKGGVNVTPEMGLFIAVCMYSVPRIATENTRSKLGLAYDWLRDRVSVLRGRFNRAK